MKQRRELGKIAGDMYLVSKKREEEKNEFLDSEGRIADYGWDRYLREKVEREGERCCFVVASSTSLGKKGRKQRYGLYMG